MAYNIVGNGYNYLGVTAITPPNLQINPNAPTINNMNANIGDFWLQQGTANLWFLTSLENRQAVWTPIGGGGGDITAVNGGDNINVNTVAGVATVNLNKSIAQPNTNDTGTEGLYSLGGAPFMHNFGFSSDNTFLGMNAGNLTNSSIECTAIGTSAGSNLYDATGTTFVGRTSGLNSVYSNYSTAVGHNSLINSTASNFCTAIGSGSLGSYTGNYNTAIGSHSTGGIGSYTGDYHIFIGFNSGTSIGDSDGSSIMIGNEGQSSDAHTIRLGTQGSGDAQQNNTYIAGIYANTVDGGTQQTVIIDSTGKLGSIVGGGGDISAVDGGTNINVDTVAGIATVNLNDSIALPNTNGSGTQGLYSLGGFRFMHNYGTNNTFLGKFSGTLSLTGTDNTAVGYLSGGLLSSGVQNVLLATGSGKSLSSGSNNSFCGFASGFNLVDGVSNVGVGNRSLFSTTSSSYSVALGESSLHQIAGGDRNIAIGSYAGDSMTGTASDNILIGYEAGTAFLTNESNNLIIFSDGVVGDNHTIRIGSQGSGAGQQNKAYMAGIHGNSVDGGTQQFMIIDSDGKMGSTAGGGGGGDLSTLTGDTGAAAVSTGGNIDIAGGLNINTESPGSGSTVTVNLNTSISQPITNGSGTEGLYSLGGDRFMHNYGTANVFLGGLAGNLTLTSVYTTALGSGAASSLQNGDLNTCAGAVSLPLLTNGENNSAFGAGSGANLVDGNYNLLLSHQAGINLAGSESSNVLLSNDGVLGESNTIRIGTEGSGDREQDNTYIAGIYNNTVDAGTQQTVIIDSTGKLGSVVSGTIIGSCRVFTGTSLGGAPVPTYYDCTISATTNPGDDPLVIFTNPIVSPTLFKANVSLAWSSSTNTTTGTYSVQYSGGSQGASSFVTYNIAPVGGSAGYVVVTDPNTIQITATQGAAADATNYVGFIQIAQF